MSNNDPTPNEPTPLEPDGGDKASDNQSTTLGFSIPEAITPEEQTRSRETTWQWLQRQQLKIALGSVAASIAVGYASGDGNLETKALEASEWVSGSYIASEVAWFGGAALMLAGAGSKIGNPLKLREKWNEVKEKLSDNKKYKSGMVLSGIGGLGIEAAIVAGATVTELPPDAWAVLGPSVLLGTASTIWPRKIAMDRMRANRLKRAELDATQPDESEAKSIYQISVRRARQEDAERLSEIGKSRYRQASTDTEEADEEATEMFRERLTNATPQWAYVCEVDGMVEGSVTGFRTNKPWEDFVSWEESTANGTLEGRVNPEGKYVYVVNMTVNPKAVVAGGVEMLMANLIAEGIKEGVEYGYFVSRMPLFKAWLKRWARNNGTNVSKINPEQLDRLAQEYVDLHEEVNGKEVRSDHELRLYEDAGFEMGRLVRNAYTDPKSLDYGVLFKAPIPPNNVLKKVKPVRYGMSAALKIAAKHPKLLERML
jgi:hypothetical protein